MAKRPVNRLGKIMQKCSPKKAPKNTNWKKMGYNSYMTCVKRENKKR